MTNFQGARSVGTLRWITPERALQTIPAVLGTAVAMLMIAFVARPIWESTRERQEDVNNLLIKVNTLPVVKQDLANQLRELTIPIIALTTCTTTTTTTTTALVRPQLPRQCTTMIP